ncbi:MAG: VanZ family protein [Oscillospiraceae bacterium]|nr:VanZ family protein [Oscillospiraceae bacterium]
MRDILQSIYRFFEYRLGELGIALAPVPFICIALAVYWLVRRAWHRKKFGADFKAVRKKAWLNETVRLLLLFWAIETACITLFPMWFWTIVWDWLANGYHWVGELRFVPWKFELTLWRVITEPEFAEIAFRSGIVDEMVENVLLFMPLGLGLPFMLKRGSIWKTLLAGFSCTFFIELVQPFISREGTLNDVVCNTLGTALGLLLFLVIKLVFPKLVEKGRITVYSSQ